MKKNLYKLIGLWIAAVMLFSLTACDGGRTEILFAVNIEDGTVVTESAYTFTASAACGTGACALRVTCNGAVAESGEDGKYTVYLHKGDNKIAVRATSGDTTATRTFTVTYRTDFAIDTDIDEAVIRNDVLTFTVSATLNGQPCAYIVTDNGETVTEKDGKYAVTLAEKSEHEIRITARQGSVSETLTRTVTYDGFTLITTLKDQNTAQDTVAFSFSARYGDEPCDKSVTVNGTPLSAEGGLYTLTMPAAGAYEVALTARRGHAEKTSVYTVRYTDAPPAFQTFSLADDAQYKGKRLSFDLRVTDGLDGKIDDGAVAFAADFDADDGAENFVSLGNGDIAKVWSDDEKTSYRVDFTQGKFASCKNTPLLFRVTAEAFGKSTSRTVRMTYVGAGANGEIGQVVFSTEGFTIGCGYFFAPQYVTIYDGVPFSKTITDLFTASGLTYRYTGQIESAFYLSHIVGLPLDGNRIPDSLAARVNPHTLSLEKGDGSLGEFDYASGSGWMYSVNGAFPNFGFSDYFAQDGDVVRVQFTLALGNDIGGGKALGNGAGSGFLERFADYGEIHALLARLLAEGLTENDATAYAEALAAVAVWDAPQAEIDRQIEKLKAFYVSI